MKKIKTYAWYFPNWHPTSLNNKWHGKDWTEWECVKCALPRFEGHIQPKKPLWGYEDESNPEVFAKKIQTAHDYGINGFIFDYYWFKKEGPYRRDCLEKGFLGAENNELCEFSVMWCNHDPIYVHPASYKHENPKLASGDVDEAFVKEVTDYCIKNYFPRKNYQRVDGKIYFGIWDMKKFIDNFNGIEGASEVLEDFRSRASKAGFDIHLATYKYNLPGFSKRDKALADSCIKKLGIDSLFSYSWLNPASVEWPKVEYSAFRDKNVQLYEGETKFSPIPLDITVSTGWDSSPRTVQSDIYENTGYPFCSVVVNNTPSEVEKSFECAKSFLESDKFSGNFLTLSTWNEWTEGNYFEPDEAYGYGYLESYKKVFGKK